MTTPPNFDDARPFLIKGRTLVLYTTLDRSIDLNMGAAESHIASAVQSTPSEPLCPPGGCTFRAYHMAVPLPTPTIITSSWYSTISEVVATLGTDLFPSLTVVARYRTYTTTYTTSGEVATEKNAAESTIRPSAEDGIQDERGIYSIVVDSTTRSCTSQYCNETTLFSNETFDANDSELAFLATTQRSVVHHTPSSGHNWNMICNSIATVTTTTYVTMTDTTYVAIPPSPPPPRSKPLGSPRVSINTDQSTSSLRAFAVAIRTFFLNWFIIFSMVAFGYLMAHGITLLHAGKELTEQSMIHDHEPELCALALMTALLTLESPLTAILVYLEPSYPSLHAKLNSLDPTWRLIVRAAIIYGILLCLGLNTNKVSRRIKRAFEEREEGNETQHLEETVEPEKDQMDKEDKLCDLSHRAYRTANSNQTERRYENEARENNERNVISSNSWEVISRSDEETGEEDLV